MYAKGLRNMSFCCNQENDDYGLKRAFIEWLHESTRQSMHSYWSPKENATVHDIVRHLTLIANLQYGLYLSVTLHTVQGTRPITDVYTRMIGRILKNLQETPMCRQNQKRHSQHKHLQLLPCQYLHSSCPTPTTGTRDGQ